MDNKTTLEDLKQALEHYKMESGEINELTSSEMQEVPSVLFMKNCWDIVVVRKSLENMKVMKAFIEGKQIQSKQHGHEEWEDRSNPLWNWENFDYRVKPEPKLRPWKYKEAIEHFGETVKYTSQDGSSECVKKINSVFHHNESVQINDLDAETFMKKYKFLDGSPCGVIEEQ